MRPFFEKFKDIGEKETRVVKVFERGDFEALPPDEYAFVELYCDEKNCDCRRVMIMVLAKGQTKIPATINLGFDSRKDDAGPFLDSLNHQSEHSKDLMALFLDVINTDPAYLARLQRHYVMFKEKIDRKRYTGAPFETPGEVERVEKTPPPASFPRPGTADQGRPKVGRNEPCPCGSGKKYKQCCMIASEGGETMAARPADASGCQETGEREAMGASGEKSTERLMEDARALVRSVVRRESMERKRGRKKIDLTAEETVRVNPLMADALLALLLDEYAPDGTQRQISPSYQACLSLLELALTEIRYSIERNRQWAIAASERIQQEMAARAFKVEVDARVQADLTRAVYEAGLKIHPEITSKSEELAEYYGRFMAPEGKPDFDRLFEDLASMSQNDPFELMDQIMAELDLLPAPAQMGALVEMARARNPLIRDLSALMLLHPHHEVRGHLPSLWLELVSPESVSPEALRRMIGIRNWLPEAKRPALDELIRKVRAAPVPCAPMPPPQRAATYASPFDGSGAQVVWSIVGKKRDHRMVSVLVKQGIGIREVMRLDGLNKRDADDLIKQTAHKVMSEKIDLSYRDRLVPHFIWVGQQLGNVPPAGLLRAAEELGCPYWVPRRVVMEDEISSLEEEIDPRWLSSENVSRVLGESRGWPANETFARSWFEDDSSVDELLAGVRGLSSPPRPGALKTAIRLIIEQVIRPKYEVWAERLLWTTLWAKACLDPTPVPWEELFIVACALGRGNPPEDIPLLTAAAEVSVFSALARKKTWPKHVHGSS